MVELVRTQWRRRPWWMNALLAICAYMALVYVPRDLLFTPFAADQEVWLGVVLRGGWAKATEPLHWAIHAAGTCPSNCTVAQPRCVPHRNSPLIPPARPISHAFAVELT